MFGSFGIAASWKNPLCTIPLRALCWNMECREHHTQSTSTAFSKAQHRKSKACAQCRTPFLEDAQMPFDTANAGFGSMALRGEWHFARLWHRVWAIVPQTSTSC
eukprot:587681-Amphidinium_carterae.1